MSNSHFTDSTGLPNQEHYTSAKDLAILGRALVNDFRNTTIGINKNGLLLTEFVSRIVIDCYGVIIK